MVTNPLTVEDFHESYPKMIDSTHLERYYGLCIGDLVVSKRERWSLRTTWRIVAVGVDTGWSRYQVLLETPTKNKSVSDKYDRYWSYGLNEKGEQVIRRIMLLTNITKAEEEEKEKDMCGCRRGHCYCDTATLEYEVNEHSSTIDVSKGYRRIRLSLEECAELASFLASAKTKIKEAKLAALKEQQDELAKQLKEVEAM